MFSGPTGYMSLATAAFFGLGFYMAAVFGGTMPFAVIIILAGVVGFVVALLVGALTLRLKGRLLRHLHLRPGSPGPDTWCSRSSGS